MAGKFGIPQSEFEKRWATAQAKMAKMDLDVLIAHGDEADPSNVRYLSDYWPLFETGGVALGRKGEPVLLPDGVSRVDGARFQARSPSGRVPLLPPALAILGFIV